MPTDAVATLARWFRGVRPRSACLGLSLAIATVLAGAEARADDDSDGESHLVPGFRAEGFLAVVGGELATRPTIGSFSTPGTVSYPGLQNVSLSGGPTPAAGLDAHGGLRMRGRFGVDFPLGGLRLVFGTNDARATLRGNKGETAAVDITEALGTVALPGVGGHATLGPLLLTASIHPVLQFASGWGTVTQGFVSADVDAGPSFDLGLDVDVRICHSLGHDAPALCAAAEPLLWRTSSAQGCGYNGVLFGLGIQAW